MLLVGTYGLQQILFLWVKPEYSSTLSTTFADFNSNTERLNIDTEFTTIAAKLSSHDVSASPIDPESIARIQFYWTERTDASNFSFNFVNATRCKDLYATEIASQSIYANEFSDPSWICPDVSDI